MHDERDGGLVGCAGALCVEAVIPEPGDFEPLHHRAPGHLRLAVSNDGDEMPAGMCQRCGLIGYHRTPDACIEELRDLLGEVQLRGGAVVCAILRPHTEAHAGLGRPKRGAGKKLHLV